MRYRRFEQHRGTLRGPDRHPPPPGRPGPLRRRRRHRRAGRAGAARDPGHRRLPGRDPPADPARRAGLGPSSPNRNSMPCSARATCRSATRQTARHPPPGTSPRRRRPRQHRMAARPVGQPRTSWGTWRSRPGTWPPPAPPTRPPWTSPHGWPPPTPPTPAGSATCRSATTSWGTWRSRPGTWPPPAPPTRPPWTSAPGWPPPTPPTPDGSATCRSATTSWATWRSRPGTWPPPAPPTRPPWTSRPAGRRRPRQHRWQRDLSVSHEQAGRLAVAAGDLAAARTAYQASLDIAEPAGRRRPRQHRMAARPVRQPRKAGGCGGGGRGPGRRPHRLPGRPGHRGPGWPPPTPPTPAGSATCRSATTSWGTWRSRPGTWPPPAPPTRPPWTSRVRLAAADPANTGWQRDLSVSHEQAGRRGGRGRGPGRRPHRLPGRPGHPRPGWPPPTPPTPAGSATCPSATNKLGDVAVAAGDLAAARTAYQAALDIRDPAGRRRPRQHRLAARPVRQPRTAGGRGDRGRGPGRRPHRLPGRPGHPHPAGRRRPRQHRMAARAGCDAAEDQRPRQRNSVGNMSGHTEVWFSRARPAQS